MNYKVELTDSFKKEAKRLIKKYPSLKLEIAQIGIELSSNPKLGVQLSNEVYKIRLSIASKAKGKSGGARIIYFIKIVDETIFLLSIYDKSEKSSISDQEIKSYLKEYL